jgi:hypothetical protein
VGTLLSLVETFVHYLFFNPIRAFHPNYFPPQLIEAPEAEG